MLSSLLISALSLMQYGALGTADHQHQLMDYGESLKRVERELRTIRSERSGGIMENVHTTRHGAYESGACELPSASYNIDKPVALGDIDSLGYLKYSPAMCGHVLNVDCGHGPLDIIVVNSNLGQGLDLYASSWSVATGNQSPGETSCSVQLSNQNPFNFDGPRCYYAPGGDKNNDYFHLLGVFNTNDRIVVSATLAGKPGIFNGIQPYFAFNGFVDRNAQVQFSFQDGSTFAVELGDCVAENGKQMWS